MMQNRTHNCGELRIADAGKSVKIVGWMENVRVHTNDYLVRRLLEKGGRLEEPTDYIVLK